MASLIQPRYGEDTYTVGRLVFDRMKALGLSRTGLVRRLGYRDLNSGQRGLTEVLLTGIVPPFIEGKLAHALEVEQDVIDMVLLATAQQHHDEAHAQILANEEAYRATFRPHLQVETERQIPSPIFIAALLTTRRLRSVPLPDDTFLSGEEARDRGIKTTITEHYRNQRGQVPAFGGITGYVAVLLLGYGGIDFGLSFDVCGDPAGPMRTVPRLPEAMLGTKSGDTRLTGLLNDTPIKVNQMQSFRPTRRGATHA
jgi:hypothetical protein